MRERLQNNKVCAIMRNVPLKSTLNYADTVYEGGIRLFEIAMNSKEAVEQIRLLRSHFGTDVSVGAGTVIDLERCKAAEAAGAQFFLTPSASECTLRYCREREIPLLPGVMTPTDVAVCLSYGYSVMKLFPAGDLPPQYIKSLKGPFDGTEYVAVGGVTPENAKSFLDNGFIGVGIGGNLIPKELMLQQRWKDAETKIHTMMQRLEGPS